MAFSYHVGLFVPLESPTYIKRRADQQLYEALLAGEFCYVLTSRQMGKSSLRVQVMQQLKNVGVNCSSIDLTGIGSKNITSDQWYRGIMNQILKDLHLTESFDIAGFYEKQSDLGSVQRLSNFIDEILLNYLTTPLVVFVDEIDSIISLSFDSDDFFAWIRYCCNQRADFPHYQRLTFCLLGVATPTDLIQDGTRTPFNLGTAIELEQFSLEQIKPLMVPLAAQFADIEEAHAAIYEWTGGQPFLTQRLCQMIQESDIQAGGAADAEKIKELVRKRIVTNWGSQDQKSHLQTIRSRLLNKDEQAVGLLAIYQQVLRQPLVVNAEDLPEVMALRLTGLVVSDQDCLVVYNRIYREVFDEGWVEQELAKLRPYAGSLGAWLAGGQDDAFLLAGQGLVDAQAWAGGRRLSEVDYQYLTASQRLDTDRVKAEAEQIITQVKADAEKITSKARRTASRWTLAGAGGFVVAAAATGWGLYNYNELTWRADIVQDSESINVLPVNTLDRLIKSVKAGRKLQERFHGSLFPNYPSYKPIEGLQDALVAGWHETNIIRQERSFKTTVDQRTLYQADDFKIDDKKITSYDFFTNPVEKLQQNFFRGLAVSADGETIVSGSQDRTVKIWKRDGSLFTTIPDHQGAVNSVAVSADGETIVSGSQDKTVKVWKRNGSLLTAISGHQGAVNSVAVSADGETIVSGSQDKTVKVWKRNGSLLTTIYGHQGAVNSVAVSTDGETIVSGGQDKVVKVWKRDASLITTLYGHQDVINSVAISSSKTIISGDSDNVAKIWQCFGCVLSTNKKHRGIITSIAVSADGETIVSGSQDKTVKLWGQNGSLLNTIPDHRDSVNTTPGHTDWVNSVAVSADGQTIVSGSRDKTVKIWKQNGSLLATLSGHTGWVNSVAVSADGQTIVSGSRDKTVKLWKRNGSLLATLCNYTDSVNSVAVSADGQTIISSDESMVKVWKRDRSPFTNSCDAASTDKQNKSFSDTDQLKEQNGFFLSSFELSQASSFIATSADSQIIISSNQDKKGIEVLRQDGSYLYSNPDDFYSAAISADGQIIFLGSGNQEVRVLRQDRNGFLLLFNLFAPQEKVNGLAVSQNGKVLVFSGSDQTVKVWHFDLDYLLTKGCEQLQEYLDSHPEEDRSQLCPK